jgi:acylphosphatase
MVCKRVFLSGKVQGVSFRFHAHEQATKLGVTGWIRNNDDGRVELLVAGEAAAVEHMISWARKGPPAANVEKVDITDVKDHLPKEPFFIRRDGGK